MQMVSLWQPIYNNIEKMELKEYDNNDNNIVNKGKPVSFSCYK